MEINTYLANKLQIEYRQVTAVLKLLDEGCSIPFIARYRKEETSNLSDVTLRQLEEEKEKFEKLEERKKTILASIEEQGKLTDELRLKITQCESLSLLETIYRPYKPKRSTRGSIARDKGLTPLSEFILKQSSSIGDLYKYASTFINKEKGLDDVDTIINMAKDIIAEDISDNPSFYLFAKSYINRTAKLTSKQTKEDIDNKYLNYASFVSPIYKVKPYQTLALLRGKKEKKLSYSFDYDEITIINEISRNVIKRNSPYFDLLKETITDSYKRLIKPSVENEIISDLTTKAEDSSLVLFSKNLKQLLLEPPLKNKQILGFDPGFRNGCKLALINKQGDVIKTTIIYPTIGKEKEAENILLSMYKQYGFDIVALGNGTASRESEAFLNKFIGNNNLKEKIEISIVNESGASIYSASPLAIKEFPNMDIDERSAVSLARRLLDPISELVKIPPESIGVGQYQHDLDQKRLKQTLGATTIDTVNEVGVYLNTSSISLLKYVSGLNEKMATNIVEYRNINGPFKERKELLKVKGIGEKTYMDAIGFLRIENSNPLEKTSVHPKDYNSTFALLKLLNISLDSLGKEESNEKLDNLDNLDELAKKLNLGIYTLKDIIEELKKPGRDPREKVITAKLDSSVKDIKDLKMGMELFGTVRNLSDFGAFIDIGVHQDGLVHISEISSSFIKHPSEKLSLGEIVKVKVIGIDLDRKRISLSIKQVNSK